MSCFDLYEEGSSEWQDCDICKCECIVQNASGIHVRPAGMLVKLFENKQSDVSFTYEGKTVNAKSIISILMLGAPQGGKIQVCVRGKDAKQVIKQIQEAFASGFGE